VGRLTQPQPERRIVAQPLDCADDGVKLPRDDQGALTVDEVFRDRPVVGGDNGLFMDAASMRELLFPSFPPDAQI
jgi:hypothetical protein